MKKSSKTPTQKPIVTNILISLSLLLAVIALVVSFYAVESLNKSNNDATANHLQMQANQAQLEHCYDEKIHPCDEESINTWNEANPDHAFNIYRG